MEGRDKNPRKLLFLSRQDKISVWVDLIRVSCEHSLGYTYAFATIACYQNQ